MIFTKVATYIAALMCVLGVLRMAMVLAFGSDPEMMKAYVGGKSPGHYIDQATVVIFYGLVVGVLTEISRSIARLNSKSVSDQRNQVEGGE
ncbi:hypothetical protein [Shimia haliotis]|uniref:Uncharacterized protein n=1 Tax=Shimia haliotis TaxID=1280847 RepID=A0A1I4B0X1_9RHOB|nr:hypothetical protein [Shimia haliotis]SFK62030.1 hypothetical protein SAMN04488036_101709 [Shimia haliotis]